jgi:3-hydroxyacyl-[acyl-carrier-protein] dehydratase
MAACGFQRRPVAGLAGGIELLSTVRPGQKLELAAHLEDCDLEAVAYNGTAHADGVPVLRLIDCVGPMVPMEEFDAPQPVRQRFELLCEVGAVPGDFAGLPQLSPTLIGREAGRSVQAQLQVPAVADFFLDHFPRRPVFPGSLLMHFNLQLACALAEEIAPQSNGKRWQPRMISNMKLREFIAPGETLELKAELGELGHESAELDVTTRAGRRLLGSAQVQLVTEDHS